MHNGTIQLTKNNGKCYLQNKLSFNIEHHLFSGEGLKMRKRVSEFIVLLTQIPIICSLTNFSVESKFSKVPYYAVDPLKTAQLAILEHHLITKLSNINYKNFVQTDLCGAALLNYVTEYTQDGISVVQKKRKHNQDFSQTFSENPILALKMIRRIYVTLVENIVNLACEDNDHITKTIKEAFHETNVRPPTDKDYEDAMLGLLRIQFVYGLNASQVSKSNKYNYIQQKI